MCKIIDAAKVQTSEFNKLLELFEGGVSKSNTPGNITSYNTTMDVISVSVRISKTVMKALNNSTDLLIEAKTTLSDLFPSVDIYKLRIYLSNICRSNNTVYLEIKKPLDDTK
ncbi:MAG: hypothetical protein ACRCX2_07255 [Paraclostridium sp.]